MCLQKWRQSKRTAGGNTEIINDCTSIKFVLKDDLRNLSYSLNKRKELEFYIWNPADLQYLAIQVRGKVTKTIECQDDTFYGKILLIFCEFLRPILAWQEQRKWLKKVSSLSENHFLHIPADILVIFPVILLLWSLSLSPVWLNIEGRQDFRYKTQIIFFYFETNSDSINLIVVHCIWFVIV